MNDYKQTLIRTIRLMAKDLYENAEKYVGDKEYMANFDIWMHFPQFDEAPTIEIVSEYFPDKYSLAFDPNSEEAKKELEKPFPAD